MSWQKNQYVKGESTSWFHLEWKKKTGHVGAYSLSYGAASEVIPGSLNGESILNKKEWMNESLAHSSVSVGPLYIRDILGRAGFSTQNRSVFVMFSLNLTFSVLSREKTFSSSPVRINLLWKCEQRESIIENKCIICLSTLTDVFYLCVCVSCWTSCYCPLTCVIARPVIMCQLGSPIRIHLKCNTNVYTHMALPWRAESERC